MSSIPNKVGEYLSGGLPIVSSLDGVVKQLFKSSGAGINYTEKRPSELANCILQLSNSKIIWQQMTTSANQLFNKYFDADIVYANFAEYLEKVVEGYRSRKK